MSASNDEQHQQHTSEEFVYQKINELDVEGLAMIAKKLSLNIDEGIKNS